MVEGTMVTFVHSLIHSLAYLADGLECAGGWAKKEKTMKCSWKNVTRRR